jgi:hypothetical protein
LGIQRKRHWRGKDRNTETRRRDTKRKRKETEKKQAEKVTGRKKARKGSTMLCGEKRKQYVKKREKGNGKKKK